MTVMMTMVSVYCPETQYESHLLQILSLMTQDTQRSHKLTGLTGAEGCESPQMLHKNTQHCVCVFVWKFYCFMIAWPLEAELLLCTQTFAT